MNERVEELVAEFVQRREDGEALEPEDFVAAHPDCADELRSALAALGLVEAALPDRGAVPARVGDWEVEGELGRGGMSRVLAARRGEQRAAIKLLGSGVFASPRALERLRREGELLLRFSHPNVVRVLELGSTDGLPYLALERIDGASLAERIATARADGACAAAALPGEGSAEARAARLVAALARAVHAAHGVGLLHRDIKPGNVLLRGDGTPVLIDFGLSADESAATLTQSGDLLGTPQFMAPEQARGERADARTDVYGLGVVLLELLARTSRFPADDAAKALARVRREPLALGPELRGPLRTILARALAFARAQRFAGALDLAVQLERVASNAPISVRDLPLPVRIAGVARRHRRFAATAIALLVVVVASLSWSRFGGDGGSRLVTLAALRAAIADAWLAEDAPALATALDDLSALEPMHPLVSAIPAFANQAPVDEPIAALVEGARALVREEPGQAIEPLERAAARFADEPLALVMLGIAAERAGRGARAAEALSAAVHLLPHSSASRLALARVHRKAERHADAELLLVEASRIAPRAVEVWIALCDVRLRLKDSRGALVDVERGLAIAGPSPSLALRASYATALDANQRFAEAHAIFRELVAQAPDDVGLAYTFAYSLDRAHRMVEAKAAYIAVSRRRPKSATLHATIAWLASGASAVECEECRRYYAEHAELIDAAEAESRVLESFAQDKGRNAGVLDTLVKVARHLDRRESLRSAMNQQLEAAHRERDDARILKLTKALHALGD